MRTTMILIPLFVFIVSCAPLRTGNSYSAFGDEALTVARVITERLSGKYPPARTTLYFEAQEGGVDGFGGLLEEICMHTGFTVAREPADGAVRVRYLVDLIQGAHPLRAYLYLETTDLTFAQSFSPTNFAMSGSFTEYAPNVVEAGHE